MGAFLASISVDGDITWLCEDYLLLFPSDTVDRCEAGPRSRSSALSALIIPAQAAHARSYIGRTHPMLLGQIEACPLKKAYMSMS